MNNNETVIPKGSRLVLKLATIFQSDALVVYNHEVVLLTTIKEKAYGPRMGDQKTEARLQIYQFFVEIREIVVGSQGLYGRRPVRPVMVKWVGERPDPNDSTKKTRWVTFEFEGGLRKTKPYNMVSLDKPMLIPLQFDQDLYRPAWDVYRFRDRGGSYPKQLTGSYYSTEIIDGVLYANNPIYPEKKSEEELLMEMEPVNKKRLLDKLRSERDRIDFQIEILERENT